MYQGQSRNINENSYAIRCRTIGDACSRIPPESVTIRKAYRARGHRCIVIFPHASDARGEVRSNCNAVYRRDRRDGKNNVGVRFSITWFRSIVDFTVARYDMLIERINL